MPDIFFDAHAVFFVIAGVKASKEMISVPVFGASFQLIGRWLEPFRRFVGLQPRFYVLKREILEMKVHMNPINASFVALDGKSRWNVSRAVGRVVVLRESRVASNGFTLIEIMIVVAIVAILAAIAIPSYAQYIKRSRAKSASADLVALGLNFENFFQRTLSYPATGQSTTTTAGTKTLMPGWGTSMDQFFTFKATTTTTTYELAAIGTGGMAGCDLVLKNDNTRTVSSSSACGGFSSW